MGGDMSAARPPGTIPQRRACGTSASVVAQPDPETRVGEPRPLRRMLTLCGWPARAAFGTWLARHRCNLAESAQPGGATSPSSVR